MKKRKLRKQWKILLVLILLISGIYILNLVQKEPVKGVIEEQTVIADEEEPEISEKKEDISIDYRGRIIVGDIIDEIVMQSEDNSYYLNYNSLNEEDTQGAIFMDYRNTIEDPNVILYGHYVYYDDSAKFTPLTLLMDYNNYEANKTITFETLNDVRTYEIAYVYHYEMNDMTTRYYLTDYEDELESYISRVKEKAFYDTGIEINKGDSLLTLQTCVRNREDLRLIVLAKRIK